MLGAAPELIYYSVLLFYYAIEVSHRERALDLSWKYTHFPAIGATGGRDRFIILKKSSCDDDEENQHQQVFLLFGGKNC